MHRLLLLLLLVVPPAANAEIYKWTDAQGRVHFSDKATDKAANQPGKTETVEVKDYKPGTDEDVRQIYERNDRLRKAVTEKTPAQRRAEADTEKRQRAECKSAQQHLSKISGRVVFHDADGKVVPTTEKERAAQERELRAWIGEHCP